MDSIEEKIGNVLNNPELVQKIVRNGQEWLREKCNERIMARQVEKFIMEIMN